MIIAAGLLLARSLKVRPSPFSLVLIATAILFAVVTFIRQEAFTVMISFLLCFLSLGLLSATFTTGNWVFYKIGDFIRSGLLFLLAALIRPPDLFSRKQPSPSLVPAENIPSESGQEPPRRRLF